MLADTPQELYEELRQAEKYRDDKLHAFDQQLRRYFGPAYAKRGSIDNYPENHYYEYISLMLPRVSYNNPRVRIVSRRLGMHEVVAEALATGTNRQFREQKIRRLCTEIATDMLFNWGIVLTAQEPLPGKRPSERWVLTGDGYDRERIQPFGPRAYRVSQRNYVQDPQALTHDAVRFKGHKYLRDKEDLLEEAKRDSKLPEDDRQHWNLKLLEEVCTGTSFRGSEMLEAASWPHAYRHDRDQIEIWEIHIPEHDWDEGDGKGPEQGYHGVKYTLAVHAPGGEEDDPKLGWLKPPVPYYGPRWGPYTMFGVYPVPDMPLPMSPLVAVDSQIRELNKHSKAVSKAMADYKRLIFVDSGDPDLADQVRDGSDSLVIPVDGLAMTAGQKVVTAEIGGVTEQHLTFGNILRARLDRNSGVTEAMRGNVTGLGTATEQAMAGQSADSRVAFVQQQFNESVAQVAETYAWYNYHDDRVVIPLGPDMTIEGEELEFQGGEFDLGSDATFEDLELEVEPYSMERTTETTQQRRNAEMLNIVTQVAPMIPQMPWVKWDLVLRNLGQSMNVPNLHEIVNLEVAAKVAQQEAQEPARPTGRLKSQVAPGGQPGHVARQGARSVSGGQNGQATGREGAPVRTSEQ
jgi:hypothetical protein